MKPVKTNNKSILNNINISDSILISCNPMYFANERASIVRLTDGTAYKLQLNTTSIASRSISYDWYFRSTIQYVFIFEFQMNIF